MESLYWYDYETYGLSVTGDRPVQFVGIRTNYDLEVISTDQYFCKITEDYLPNLDSCLIHGWTPISVPDHALNEKEFANRIHESLSQEGTCAIGFNSMQFDHRVTQNLFYRNLKDPYAWQHRNSNSCWDIIDLLRATSAFRPEGINWPANEQGPTSFKLSEMAEHNNIEMTRAHDALCDVEATIELAKLLKTKQPKIYEYAFNLRKKENVRELVMDNILSPLLFTSAFHTRINHHTTLVAPLVAHPEISSYVIAYDLRQDPTELLDRSVEEIRELQFTKTEDLAEGASRPGFLLIKMNKSPFLCKPSVFENNKSACSRINLDLGAAYSNLEKIKANPGLIEKAKSCYEKEFAEEEKDVDHCLYSGGFIDDHDRFLLDSWTELSPEEMTSRLPQFTDSRLEKMAWRYLARNHPNYLDSRRREAWKNFCRDKLFIRKDHQGLTKAARLRLELEERSATNDSSAQKIIRELVEYVALLESKLSED